MENVSSNFIPRKYLVSHKSVDNWDAKKQWRGFCISEKLTRIITTDVWSPIVFKGGIRAQENFISSDWAVFDFDEHKDIAQVSKELCDFVYIIAPTKSHTEAHHRYRVCIPWERTITDIHEYRYNISRLIDEFGADEQCKDAARFFWPSKFIYKINLEGDRLNVLPAPRHRVYEPTKLLRPEEAVISPRIMRLFQVGIEQGQRNKLLWGTAKDLFNDGFSWEEIAILIRRIPLKPKFEDRDYAAIITSARRSEEKNRKTRQDQRG